MDNSNPFPRDALAPDAQVISLRCHSITQFDPQVLAQAFATRPKAEVEEMLCRILESIAQWLDQVEEGLTTLCFKQIDKPARRIALLAGQIGLTELAVAAGHVGRCAVLGDAFALAATIGRLERAFDQAVTEVWDFRHR
ncbi:hypothetical protein [Yoonia sp.]|uniref:hypothetical protein n=1 Tax=Yoonia sp. TaxID=2212373 RepID=UPI003A4DB774